LINPRHAAAPLVQGEQTGEERVVVEPTGMPVVAPAVGLGRSSVEPVVGLAEPGGALVCGGWSGCRFFGNFGGLVVDGRQTVG
jgi:hypothetical protein